MGILPFPVSRMLRNELICQQIHLLITARDARHDFYQFNLREREIDTFATNNCGKNVAEKIEVSHADLTHVARPRIRDRQLVPRRCVGRPQLLGFIAHDADKAS